MPSASARRRRASGGGRWKRRLAAPVAGYGLAWIGHFVYEKNRPASWGGVQEFVWSLRGDLRMWRYMVAGMMDGEVERVGPPLEVVA